MSASIEAGKEAIDGDRLARRNVLVLAFGQALAGANSTVIVGTAGIVGGALADRSIATLPVSTFVVGMWIGTLPVGIIAKRFGRLASFEAGAFCGMLAGLTCASAVIAGSFLLLCVGTLVGGLYAAAHQSYRFAAADTASAQFKPKAISWVLAGGVLAGVFGPQLIILTKDVLPQYLFAASYFAQAIVAVLAAAVLLLVRIPMPPPAMLGQSERPRPLSAIYRQPKLISAVICGVASYSMMYLIMTSAPVAMVESRHSVNAAALGLQWHVMAMYAPSFVTGSLIAWIGANRVVAAGLALTAAGAWIGMLGLTVTHFWLDLILLGVGWNFGFIGATAAVVECHRASERNKVQSVNDFLIFGAMAISSFSSGQLLTWFDWRTVNEVVLLVMLVAAIALSVPALSAPIRNAAAGFKKRR